jgi:ABC-type hemin transport system substrate-binding protein
MKDEVRSRAQRFILLLALACARHEPVTTHDDVNRPVAVPPRIQRVVTLAPNLTEIVFAIGAGDRLVGTDDFSDEPAAAKTIPKVGGMQPNIEKIVALKPDLVLASTSGNQPNLAPALAAVHIPLFVVRTDRLDEIPAAMERLAGLLHAPRTDAAQELRARIAQQRRTRVHRPRVLFAVWADPLYVAGRKTFADDLLVLAGAQNAVQVDGWPQYSMESLIANPPDFILYPSKPVSNAQIEKLLAVSPGLSKRIKVLGVDENLFTRPGPRVAQAAAALNGLLDQQGSSR